MKNLFKKVSRALKKRKGKKKVVLPPVFDTSTLGAESSVRLPTIALELPPVATEKRAPDPASDRQPEILRIIGGI